ncbi:MAG: uroporphyrinogen decarboxylase family protein [SAR86 cluster bacterium]|nr:uroporphyrinogen decarboxylase family protein [SAR86 cluster bacterium]
MSNLRFKNALQRIPQRTPPIWFMRQAGRYHNHYQNLKKNFSFEDLCKTPKLAAETAMGPIEEFDFDVAILFSDILFPLESLGMNLTYNPGPIFGNHLTENNLSSLITETNPINSLEFQGEAIERTLERLSDDKSLIGFIGGPWTLISYACGLNKETKNQKLNKFKLTLLDETILPLLEQNIELQLKAGAENLMIFDSLAHQLSKEDLYLYLSKTFSSLINKFPGKIGYYAKDGIDYSLILKTINNADIPIAGLGVDSHEDITSYLKSTTHGFTQGNFNENHLTLPKEEFISYLDPYLERMASLSDEDKAGWVCGLGHGVLKTTDQENVKEFVKRARSVFC